MDLKDVTDVQRQEDKGYGEPSSAEERQEMPVLAYAEPAAQTVKKKRHILPWIITGSVLFLAVIVACVFLLLPKDSGKKRSVWFYPKWKNISLRSGA